MRIAIFANNDVGLYRFRKELVGKLAAKNEVLVLMPKGRYSEHFLSMGCQVSDIPLERRGMNPFRDFLLFLRYHRHLADFQPQVVLTYTVKPNVYGGLACRLRRVPQIANITGLGTAVEKGGLLKNIVLTLHRIGLKKARCVFFQNEHNLNALTSSGIITGKTRLIPGSGVNLEENPFEPYPAEENGLRFLFIGRITKNKGVGELLAAMKALRESGVNAALTLIGEAEEDYAGCLQDADGITFLGFRSDIHEQIKACHCLVLPSYHEGMANVLLEAASAGRPVIASRIPGCAETFDEGVSGFGCEPMDADSLLSAMKRFTLLTNREKAEMGRSGREKVERSFDRNIIIKAYLEEIATIQEETNTP